MATSVVEMDSTQVKHRPHANKQLDERNFMVTIDVEPLTLRILRRITNTQCVHLRPWSRIAVLCSRVGQLNDGC
jgi:hypothetical protein